MDNSTQKYTLNTKTGLLPETRPATAIKQRVPVEVDADGKVIPIDPTTLPKLPPAA